MTGLEAQTSQDDDPLSVSRDFETLSTGLPNLDQAFDQEGIRIGTVLTLLSDPVCSGDTLVANMVANRPTYYFTFGKSVGHVEDNIEPISNVNTDEINVTSVSSSRPLDEMLQEIQDMTLPTGGMIIVDPVNELENSDPGEYRELLYRIQQKTKENDGLAVLHALESNQDSGSRWLTEYIADTVFSLRQQQADEEIKEFLAVEKMYPAQSLVSRDARVFELSVALDIDISTSRNVSP